MKLLLKEVHSLAQFGVLTNVNKCQRNEILPIYKWTRRKLTEK